MNESVQLDAVRVRKARFGTRVGTSGYRASYAIAFLSVLVGIVLLIGKSRYGWSLIGVAAVVYGFAAWVRYGLLPLPVSGKDTAGRLSREMLAQLPRQGELTPKLVWSAAIADWQGKFVTNHLLIAPDFVGSMLSDDASQMSAILQRPPNWLIVPSVKRSSRDMWPVR
jgi:hypothetical protein